VLMLGKLIALYDDNGISIDGKVAEWFGDETPKRFEAYGWHVVRDVNGHDPIAVDAALTAAIAEGGRPSLVCCKTVIGRDAPTKQGHHLGAHCFRNHAVSGRFQQQHLSLPLPTP
jgi:transketolase